MYGTFKEHSGHPLAEIRGDMNSFSVLKVEGYLRVGQAGFGLKLTRSKTDKAASGAHALLILPLSHPTINTKY